MGFIVRAIWISIICAFIGIQLEVGLKINNKPLKTYLVDFKANIILKYTLCRNGSRFNLSLNKHTVVHTINEPGNHHLLIYLMKYQTNDQLVYISTRNSAGLVDLMVVEKVWQQTISIEKHFSERTQIRITYTTTHHINGLAENINGKKSIIPKMPEHSKVFCSVHVL